MIVDAEALVDDALQIDARRQRTTPSISLSGPVSTILASSSFCAADRRGAGPFDQLSKPLGAGFIEAVNPVAQCLPIHAADTGGVGAAHTVQNRRQRQQSPPLADRSGAPGR